MFKGKKYKKASEKITAQNVYTLEEALALLPETATTSFDSTVELHIRLGIDPKKGDQQVRGTLTFPHSFGKQKRIAVFANEADQKKATAAGAALVGGEDLIADIKKSGKADFDIAIATPEMMKHLAQVAKVLGPKGLMPSPKAETVTPDVEKAVKELSQGKITFKNDATANVHVAVGKVSMGTEALNENITLFLDTIKGLKPDSLKGSYMLGITLTTTMGPGIKVKV
ncbi:MAG: 50S ribosomal protein L1 [Patescibacteria group bacterium]